MPEGSAAGPYLEENRSLLGDVRGDQWAERFAAWLREAPENACPGQIEVWFRAAIGTGWHYGAKAAHAARAL